MSRQSGIIRRCAATGLRRGMVGLLGMTLCACVAAVAPPSPEPSPAEARRASQFVSNYRLGTGDVIAVRVFGEPDLSVSGMRLSDSGTIFLPTIGELAISGMTLGQVERQVADRLRGRILVNPKVSVSVEQYRPFFINGMVKTPGAYPYQPGLTVRKAFTLAGGLDERASLRNILIIRAGDPAMTPQRAGLDVYVYPGDVITVEQSFF